MIDPTMFNVERLVVVVLRDWSGQHRWRRHCEIIPSYMPPFPSEDTEPRCVVKCGESFLRHSAGPGQGHFWDIYGDDYQEPELALLALSEAGPPPHSWWKALVPKDASDGR